MEEEARLPVRPEMKRALPKHGEDGTDSRDTEWRESAGVQDD